MGELKNIKVYKSAFYGVLFSEIRRNTFVHFLYIYGVKFFGRFGGFMYIRTKFNRLYGKNIDYRAYWKT